MFTIVYQNNATVTVPTLEHATNVVLSEFSENYEGFRAATIYELKNGKFVEVKEMVKE